MRHNLLIAAHAACALAAFALGMVADFKPSRHVTNLFRAYLATLWLMVLFLIVVVFFDWSSIDSTSRAVFSALLALAVYTAWRGWQAGQDLIHHSATWRESFIDNVGFTLIALFAGFVIVGSIDLGAPVWLVVAIGAVAILLGRYAVQRLKERGPHNTAALRSGAIADLPDPTPLLDGLLAATARVHSLMLVTRNTADFAHTGVSLLHPFEAS